MQKEVGEKLLQVQIYCNFVTGIDKGRVSLDVFFLFDIHGNMHRLTCEF